MEELMKKNFTILFVLVFMGSAFAAKIKEEIDSFKNEKVITYKVEHKIVDGKDLIKNSDDTEYKRVIANKQKKTSIQFFLQAKTKMVVEKRGFFAVVKTLSPKAFLQVDEKVLNVNLQNWNANTTENKHIAGSADSSGASLYSSTNETIEFKPIIAVTNEIEDAIKKCKTLKIRFYADEKPVTFEVKESDLKKIIELLSKE
jgi:hypothetical protein